MALLGECTLGNILLGDQGCGGTVPVVLASFDYNGDGFAETGLAKRAQQMSITRGFEAAAGRTTTGRATIILNNRDGRYSPRLSSSPLYPNILPGRIITAERQDAAGNLTEIYTGYLDTPSVDPDPGTLQAQFTCLDLIERLRRVKISTPLYVDYTSDELIDAILDLAGWTGSTALEAGAKTFPYASWYKVTALDAIQQVVDSELGLFFIAADGTPSFHARYHRSLTTTDEFTFNNSMAALAYSLPQNDIFNEALVTVYPRVEAELPVADLWTWQEAPYYLAPNQSVTIEAPYSDDTTGAACEAETVTTPVSTTDYTANSAADGGSTDRTANLTVGFTAYGQFAEIVLTNTHTSGIYVTLLKFRGLSITNPEPVTLRATNADSIATYGFTSTIELDQPLETRTDTGQDAANYLVELYGDPLDRITVTIEPEDNTRKDAMVDLDLNDRFAVTQTNLGLSGVGFFIDKINHQMGNHHNTHTVTYEAQRAPTMDLIILDSADQTFDDLLGY